MGYFNKITETSFKKTADGTIIYYPYGAIGKGRTIPDLVTKEKLFKFHKRLNQFFFCIFLPYSFFLSMLNVNTFENISPAIFIIALMSLRQYWLIRKFPKHKLKLGIKEAMREGAQLIPNWCNFLAGSLSILLIPPCVRIVVASINFINKQGAVS